MPQLNDYVPETASPANVENKFDVLNLLSENHHTQSSLAKNLPDVQLDDGKALKADKGGCMATHTLENNLRHDKPENHSNPEKNDWLRDGSIDVEDAQVLKTLFDKANSEGGVKGEQKMLNSINQKLEDDGSDYRVSIIKSNGNTRTFQLSRLSDSKCGPREIAVDAERIHLGDDKPRPKLVKEVGEKESGEKEPGEKEAGEKEAGKNADKLDKKLSEKDDPKKLAKDPEGKDGAEKQDKKIDAEEAKKRAEKLEDAKEIAKKLGGKKVVGKLESLKELPKKAAEKLGKKPESHKNVSKYDKYSKTRELEEQLSKKFEVFKKQYS